jgi:hypothetical protein
MERDFISWFLISSAIYGKMCPIASILLNAAEIIYVEGTNSWEKLELTLLHR